ncbi:MAG: hypothetical protein AB1633_08770, partial [Elusimicrobiota bacterium]
KGKYIHTGTFFLDGLNDFTDTLRVSLVTGWNQIGMPYNTECPTQKVLLNGVSPVFWDVKYRGGGVYENIPLNVIKDTVLWPWKGYWVYNDDTLENELKFLPLHSKTSAKECVSKRPLWFINLCLKTNYEQDIYNYIEFAENAEGCFLKSPPMLNENPELFLSPIGNGPGYFYISENYHNHKQGACFYLTFKSLEKNSPFEVSVISLEGKCPFARWAIYDPYTNQLFKEK